MFVGLSAYPPIVATWQLGKYVPAATNNWWRRRFLCGRFRNMGKMKRLEIASSYAEERIIPHTPAGSVTLPADCLLFRCGWYKANHTESFLLRSVDWITYSTWALPYKLEFLTGPQSRVKNLRVGLLKFIFSLTTDKILYSTYRTFLFLHVCNMSRPAGAYWFSRPACVPYMKN